MSDYIRREDAKNLRFSGGINHDGFLYVPYKELVDGIKAVPSADVVPVRHAKDVYKQYNKHHCEFMCSLCGGWIGVIEGGDCDFNYCPNCGARMDA